jgi:hypothetical protein
MRLLGRYLAAAFLSFSVVLPSAARSNDKTADGNPAQAALESRIGAEIDGRWLFSDDYPKHQRQQVRFHDQLGEGSVVTLRHTGRSAMPDLVAVIKRYDNRPFATLQMRVDNNTRGKIAISCLRLFEERQDQLSARIGPLTRTRILSDSYSEDTPILRIRDFAQAPDADYRAVGSQLLYNRDTQTHFFVGALAAKRWLTVIHLLPTGMTVDNVGTTELTAGKSLSPSRPEDHVILKITVAPGRQLVSEPLLLAVGQDHLQTLRDYGAAVGRLNKARVDKPALWGWWSWTAFYDEIAEKPATRNANWLADHLASHGYRTIHLDEGYNATRGDYDRTNPVRFPDGMQRFASMIAQAGLTLGLWTAPFEVSRRSWVYLTHRDWLVKNLHGDPIQLGKEQGAETLYALDPTHPGAARHLRDTYRTLARNWRVGYIKLDFMEMSAVEGLHYRRDVSALEAERIGLAVIRAAVGDKVILDKDGSAMLPPVGIVDAGRLSNDTEHSFAGSFDAASGIAARFYMNGNYFTADPDVYCLSDHRSPDPRREELAPVSFEEAKIAIALSAVAGGMFEDGDDLPAMKDEPERLALMTNPDLLDMVRLRRAATPLDLMSYAEDDLQPSLFWLRENADTGMLSVFNWTDQPRRHEMSFDRLALGGGSWRARDIFAADGIASDARSVIVTQPPHSVRVIRLSRD